MIIARYRDGNVQIEIVVPLSQLLKCPISGDRFLKQPRLLSDFIMICSDPVDTDIDSKINPRTIH